MLRARNSRHFAFPCGDGEQQYALYEYLKTVLTNTQKRLIFTCNSNSALCKNLRHYNNYDVRIFFPLLSIPVFASELNQLADLSQTTRNLLL